MASPLPWGDPEWLEDRFGEGTILPNGDEESSGYILDAAGRVFRFWLAWDDEQGAPTLTVWRQVEEPGRWREHPEYRRAQTLLDTR